MAFSSAAGRLLFVDSLASKGLEVYFILAEAYQSQGLHQVNFYLVSDFLNEGHPAFCGLGSLTMSLNALLMDPGRIWQGVWRWFGTD